MSLDYLLKFNQLPASLRTRVSSPAVMGEINRLEAVHQVRLAGLVMRLLVGEVKPEELEGYLLSGLKLPPAGALALAADLKKLLAGLEEAAPAVPLETSASVSAANPPVVDLPAAPQVEAVAAPSPVAAQPLPADRTADDAPVARGKELVVEGNLLPEEMNQAPSAAETEVLELSEELKELSREKTLQLEIKAGGQDVIFTPEDEAEIKALSDQIGLKKTNEAEQIVAEQVDKLLKEVKISFSSQILVDRFKQILTTNLRGIRSKIDARDAMIKPIEAGGLGLEAAEAEAVLSLAAQYAPLAAAVSMEPPKKLVLPEDKLAADRMAVLKEIGARDVEYDLTRALAERQAKAETKAETKADQTRPAPAAVQAAPPAADQATPAASPANPAKRGFLFFRNNDAGSRPKLQDVKAVPKTMGPIEELQYMDTISFRRLSPLPEEAVAKIKNKVLLLEKEHYSKRLEGIKAWRKSPLNQLYLSMAQTALEQKISMAELVVRRQSAHEDYLNQGEFEAIMKLNQELRF